MTVPVRQGQHFAGKTIVVTGGASGIGRSCCELLASRGAHIVIADRDLDTAQAVARSLDGHAFALDVSDSAEVAAFAAMVEAEIGPVDGLVTSAGIIQGPPVPPEDIDMAVWDRIFDVDLKGTYLCCAQFGARMARRGSGSIVTVASLAGMRSTPLHAYGPAKAAIPNIVQNLAGEWGRSGVRVNCVSPGFVLTDMFKATIEAGHRDATILEESAALGRMVLPIEIAQAVAFLLSGEASAITGINLPVENGAIAAASWQTYGGMPARR